MSQREVDFERLLSQSVAALSRQMLEGQFIFANSAGNTTVSLLAFDGTTFCETRGTAQFGPNPADSSDNPPLNSGR